jgi:hypothetical protein
LPQGFLSLKTQWNSKRARTAIAYQSCAFEDLKEPQREAEPIGCWNYAFFAVIFKIIGIMDFVMSFFISGGTVAWLISYSSAPLAFLGSDGISNALQIGFTKWEVKWEIEQAPPANLHPGDSVEAMHSVSNLGNVLIIFRIGGQLGDNVPYLYPLS